jgi:hypothetical protein
MHPLSASIHPLSASINPLSASIHPLSASIHVLSCICEPLASAPVLVAAAEVGLCVGMPLLRRPRVPLHPLLQVLLRPPPVAKAPEETNRMPATQNILFVRPIECQQLRTFSLCDQYNARSCEYSLGVTNRMPATANILFVRTMECQQLRIFSSCDQ